MLLIGTSDYQAAADNLRIQKKIFILPWVTTVLSRLRTVCAAPFWCTAVSHLAALARCSLSIYHTKHYVISKFAKDCRKCRWCDDTKLGAKTEHGSFAWWTQSQLTLPVAFPVSPRPIFCLASRAEQYPRVYASPGQPMSMLMYAFSRLLWRCYEQLSYTADQGADGHINIITILVYSTRLVPRHTNQYSS